MLDAALTQQKPLQTLIESLEGRLTGEAVVGAGDGEFRAILNIPLNQRSVLLVDDNPGMIDLFQRYLAGKPYRVLIAEPREQAVHIPPNSPPHVIVLAVILPG